MKKLLGFALLFLCSEGFTSGLWFRNWKKRSQWLNITEKDVTFRLFTRENGKRGFRLRAGDRDGLIRSQFNGSLPTIFCAHGYWDSADSLWVIQFRKEFLELENVNFISIDWSPCARMILYDKVVSCMKQSSLYLGMLLKFLHDSGNLDLNKAHLIGHSLGAHMVAIATNALPKKKQIGRITGLDPASPLFEDIDETKRLNPKSAKFVDIIHTSSVFLGMKKPIGTVDFYPNGGYFQPGCGYVDMGCNHQVSNLYFRNTIKKVQKAKYTARKCKSLDQALRRSCNGETAFMGYYSVGSSPGLYHLEVTSPF